jgi:outer membrane protein assembly factor BamB
MSQSRNLPAAAVFFLFGSMCAQEQPGANRDWPQFRGQGGSGVADGAEIPSRWSAGETIAWKTALPGRGWSCPIVSGEYVFLTSAVSAGEEEAARKGLYLGGDRDKASKNPHRRLVIALDFATGKVLWEREAHAGVPAQPLHIKNSYASETPATDGERVYALFGDVGLFAYDLGGKPCWSRRWESCRVRAGWGTAASPVVHKGAVIVVCDNEQASFIEAMDAKTGATLWRQARDERSNWATPCVWATPARTEIVTAGTGKVRSYGLDGKLLWELKGMSSITIPTPVASAELLYVSSGFVGDSRRPIYAIAPGASGDITPKEGASAGGAVVWGQKKAAPYNTSPLLYGGQLYVLLDLGYLGAYDAKTGKGIYEPTKLAPEANAFTASPWACDGKVFCLSEDGDTYVVAAGPELRVVGKNSVGEMCMATPAMARGSLFLRTASALLCIRDAAAAPK